MKKKNLNRLQFKKINIAAINTNSSKMILGGGSLWSVCCSDECIGTTATSGTSKPESFDSCNNTNGSNCNTNDNCKSLITCNNGIG